MVFVPVVEIRKLPSFLSFKRIGRKKTKKPTAETHELFHGSFGSDVWDPFDLLNTEAVNESTLESTDNSSDGAAPDLASCSNGSSDNSGTRRSVDGWIGKKPTVSEMVEKVELKTKGFFARGTFGGGCGNGSGGGVGGGIEFGSGRRIPPGTVSPAPETRQSETSHIAGSRAQSAAEVGLAIGSIVQSAVRSPSPRRQPGDVIADYRANFDLRRAIEQEDVTINEEDRAFLELAAMTLADEMRSIRSRYQALAIGRPGSEGGGCDDGDRGDACRSFLTTRGDDVKAHTKTKEGTALGVDTAEDGIEEN